MMDYTNLLEKLDPEDQVGGDPGLQLRVPTVASVNGNGTVDLTMPDGVLVFSVSRLAGSYAKLGAPVQMLTYRGSMLVIGGIDDAGAGGPTYRAATATPRTSTSSSVTTSETAVDTVVASLVTGRTYRVTWELPVTVSDVTGIHFLRIREDSATGTQLNIRRYMQAGSTAQSFPFRLEAEYTAVSTGNKTFAGTFIRAAGAGSLTSHAASGVPAYMYVDYVRN